MAFQHVIVIGGGIAGLLATRVLADHCKRITVIERDVYPETPIFRPGTPQARQLHAFPLKGQHILESFFPGFNTKILAAGARMHDYASDGLYFYGARCQRLAPGLPGWSASRMLVEWQVRRELEEFPQVRLLQNCVVKGLLDENHAVRGVKYQKRGNLENPISSLMGELVIDASGSSSAASTWLRKIGYQPPRETTINPSIGYATRLYERPKETQSVWWHGIAIQGTGKNRKAGALMEIEGGQWIVLLAGSSKDYPPTDEAAFLEFARGLPDQTLYEAIKEATPRSDIYGYRPIGNRFRHYEQMNMPQGFIVLGDATCTFNPIYGQGVTVAALEAQVLDRCLRTWHQRKDPARHYQRQIARLLASPWMLATTADSTPQERKTLREKIAHWYVMNHIVPALSKDQVVQRTFLEILNMLRPTNDLLRPSIIVRAFKKSFERSTRGRSIS